MSVDVHSRATRRASAMTVLEDQMIKCATVLGLLLLGLAAPALAGPNAADVRGDRREIRQDRREVHRDSREIRRDRREIRSDVRARDWREGRQDRRDLRADRRDRRAMCATCAATAATSAAIAATDTTPVRDSFARTRIPTANAPGTRGTTELRGTPELALHRIRVMRGLAPICSYRRPSLSRSSRST